MSRQGVLSDIAIKQRWPEWFPLSIDGQELMHPIHLQKNIFKGIKVPKQSKRFTDVSRFPINDLKNFSQFGSAGREKETEFYSIMAYRKQLGSNNVMPNLQTAFQARNRADYIPPKMIRPDEGAGGVQAPATLSLGRYNQENEDAFSQSVIGSRNILSARMRSTLSNISEPADYPSLMKYLLPHDDEHAAFVSALPTKISDDEVKSKLNKIYRDDSEQLGIIERAYHASGRQHLLTIPMNNEETTEYQFEE